MKIIKTFGKILSTFLLCTIVNTANSQLTIDNNQTAQQLVDMLVGPGITTSNAVLNCNGLANGKFWGTSNLGIDSGIILSTGYVETAPGIVGINSPASQFMSTLPGTYVDPDLLALSTNPSLYDGCYLEFDFVPKGDTVKFNYVFGSEEYPGFVCSNVNDIFALLISGPGIISNTPIPTKRNVALVPGTNTPIMINTINGGNNINSYCTDIDPNAPYTQYYVNNAASPNVVFGGFTTVMTAEAKVIPCETYKLKFAISNVGDGIYESGIFLKAGSLTTTAVTTENISGMGANSSTLHTVRGCKPAIIRYKTLGCDTMNAFTFNLTFDGSTAINGDDVNLLPNQLTVPAGQSSVDLEIHGLLKPPTGIRRLVINVLHPDSILVGASVVPIIKRDTVYIYDSLFVNINTPPITVCPNTPITIEADVAPTLNYYWNPSEYNGSTTITPLALTSRAYKITVTQPGAPATCPPNSRTYFATVEQYPIISSPTDTIVCISDTVAIPVSIYPDSLTYNYLWTPSTGLRANNIGTNFFSQPPGVYNYNLKVSTPVANCTRTKDIRITVVAPEQFTSVTPQSGTVVNYNEIVNLKAQGNFLFYTWYPTEKFVDPFLNNNTSKVLENTLYQVVGIDKFGCKDTADVLIKVNYPPDPFLPNAFSPNGDGLNDEFKIPGNKYNKILKFEVYNRYGAMLFSTMDPNRGWDGTYKGKPVDQGVYMYIFTAELPNKEIKTYKGDISLIR